MLALQAVVNLATGREMVSGCAEGRGGPFGRDTYAHPVDKLRNLGVRAEKARRITALYKRRYMSDEQCFAHKGRKYRTCDLLGYPLYIYAND